MYYLQTNDKFGDLMSSFEEMINNRDHWHGRNPPLCPNKKEILLYEELIGDLKPVYMLGMTKELMHLCDVAVDLNPISCEKEVICKNWLELEDVKAGAIIGDGVLNITSFELIERMSKITSKLILRVFLERQDWMKYANFFPKEFPNAIVIETQPKIAIVTWCFNEKLLNQKN